MVDENQTTEMLENVLAVLVEARELADMMARTDLHKRLDTAWFELHQHLDAHCTCNDCIAEHERWMDDGGICPNWEPRIFCECLYCTAQRAAAGDDRG